MFKKLIAISAIIALTLSECGPGCLKCTPERKCAFCDLSKNYRKVEGGCEKFEAKDCEFASPTGFCRLCKPNTYLDIINGVCITISETLQVDNCLYYSAPKICTLCGSNYFLKSADLCEQITNPISNCVVHDINQKCKQCKSSYVLNIDKTECVSDPGEKNCGQYSFIGCSQCKDSYIRNPNYYFDLLFRVQNAETTKKLGEIIYLNQDSGVTQGIQRVCQKIKVEHCIEFENFNKCKTCEPGYFVELGKCIKNPLDSINNCEKYERIDKCIQCVQGYYLRTSKICEPVLKIQYCAEYDGSSNKVLCEKCFKEFYLAGENNCKQRTE